MSLEKIRTELDAIDKSILELLAKRFSFCKDVSDYKKKNKLKVKDSTREEEIINDRIKIFSELGYDEPEFITALFTLILEKSREKIATYSSESEPERKGKKKTISIIGGGGKMGSLFAEEFRKHGHTVLISNKEKTNSVELAQKGDLVIVTVPLEKTEKVLTEIIPHLRKEALLTDFTSIKERPLEIMKTAASNVVGGHPLFGPTTSFEDKCFILCPGKGDFSWYKQLLQSLNLTVIELSAEEHDKTMAVIQSLTHFSNLALASTLQKLGFKKTFSTPTYALKMESIQKMFSQDAELFAEIQFANAHSQETIISYLAAVHELHQCLLSGNKEEFERLFESTKQHLQKK